MIFRVLITDINMLIRDKTEREPEKMPAKKKK